MLDDETVWMFSLTMDESDCGVVGIEDGGQTYSGVGGGVLA